MNTGLLFHGIVANGETVYIPVAVRNGAVGVFISWLDAVASATITLELTSSPSGRSNSGGAKDWKDSGVAITGPAASAAGCSVVNVENVRQRYARIKIVGAAASPFEIWDGTMDGGSGDEL